MAITPDGMALIPNTPPSPGGLSLASSGFTGQFQNVGSAPAVVTSDKAQQDYNKIQAQHADIVSGIANQKTKVDAAATAKAQADAQAAKDAAAAKAAQTTADAAKTAALAKANQQPNASAGGAQPGADLSKAGQPGYDVFGNKVTPQAGYDALGNPVSATSTSTGTTGTDTGSPTLADQADRAALDKLNTDLYNVGIGFSNQIQGIQNGTIPLTPGEQAQVDGLKQQFQQLIDAQTLTNTGATGTAQIRGYQTGAAQYDPTFQAKTIGAIVSAGNQKIADLNTKMASAVASLTQGFKTNDINAVKDAWSVYQDASKVRTDALQKTIDDTTKAVADAQAQADKIQQYNLDVAKFNQTGDQNAFDNALKTEQQQFDEKYKTQTLALDQFKAGMGAGGGSMGVSSAAQLTPTGNPDPVSQKQVLDQITQKYGPMTAQAIQGLANYTINPSDWSSRAGTKGLSRAEAVSLAQMYDPTYSDTTYSIRAAYLKSVASTQTGTVGSAVNAANKSINHLTAFVTDMSKLANAPIHLGNVLLNPIETALSPARQQTMSAAQTEGLGVAEELAKFFKGTGSVDVASIDAWKSQLSTNATPSEVKGLTQGAITLLAGQLETLAEQYQSTMGKAPETDFLNASAKANLSNLKNQGYDVPIPGIYYTDKTAYLNNGGSSDALTKAYQTLANANDPNNPPTPENVLELAQIQQ